MEPEKKTNFASILVVIVALVFILGGVYLLNRSINQTNKPSSSSSTETSTVTTPTSDNKQADSTDITNSDTTDSETDDTTDITTNNGSSTDTNDTQTPSTTPVAPTTTPTAPATSSTTTSPAKPSTITSAELTENQIVAKYLETLPNNQTRWEIVNCGIKDSKYCRAGSKMRLVDIQRYTTLTVNKQYMFEAKISDSANGFDIEVINSVKPLE